MSEKSSKRTTSSGSGPSQPFSVDAEGHPSRVKPAAEGRQAFRARARKAVLTSTQALKTEAGRPTASQQKPEEVAQAQYHAYQALVARTAEVFGSQEKASLWLSTPCSDFNGQVPLRVALKAQYEPSALTRIFEPLFIRIEHGVYW